MHEALGAVNQPHFSNNTSGDTHAHEQIAHRGQGAMPNTILGSTVHENGGPLRHWPPTKTTNLAWTSLAMFSMAVVAFCTPVLTNFANWPKALAAPEWTQI